MARDTAGPDLAGRVLVDARCRQILAIIGYSRTDSTPAAIRAAALTGRILPSATPIVVMTTIRGKPVAENNARGTS